MNFVRCILAGLLLLPSLVGAETSPDYFIGQLRQMDAAALPAPARDLAIAGWETAKQGATAAGRPEPILKSIATRHTALVVVDMQRAFLDPGASIEVPEGRKLIDPINRLAAAVRAKGGSVVFLRYEVNRQVGLLPYFETRSFLGPGRLSPLLALRRDNPQFQIYPELKVERGDTVLNKTRYSACLGSNLVERLRKQGIRNVVVTGVTTDICAGGTAEGLMQKGFHVVMVWDGTATFSRLAHETTLTRFYSLYGDVMPYKEVISRLW